MGFSSRGFFSRKRIWILISLLICVPIGFYSKFYRGPASLWVNNSLSGVFYEIFWCLLIFFIADEAKPLMIAAFVLIITCILEFLQLWHPPFLELIRNTFIGRTVLGNFFIWSDFPYYFLGSGIGWLWMIWLQNISVRLRHIKDHHETG